ncbi:MAG: type I secretion system permease/ATPase [Paracoccaceae bacterium]
MSKMDPEIIRGRPVGPVRPDSVAPAAPPANPYRAALRMLRRPALVAGGFSALINVLMLTGSVYMLQVYDRVLSSGSAATLMGLFLIVTIAYAFYGIYEFLRARVLSRAAMRLNGMVAPAAFRAWLTSGLDGARASALPLRDLEILRGFIASPILGGIFDLPWIPLYLLVLYAVHPMLGLVTLAGVAVVVAVAFLNRQLTQNAIDRAVAEEAAARSFSDQGQRNAEMIAAMGMTDDVMARWRDLQGAGLATGQSAADITEGTSSFSKAFRMFLQSAMLTMGAWLVLGHEMSAGMIIAASVISGRLLAPVDQIIGQWKQIGRASSAHKRLQAYFDAQAVPMAPLGLSAPTGKIHVTDLLRLAPATAQSRERRRQIDRVSFALEPGDGLGVIGDSASGKSTLARLIVGTLAADAGEIRFDGATRDQWGAGVLGAHIGYLPQSVDMLAGTVRDNIRRFRTDRSSKDVIAAAQLAGVHEMILHLPQGYDTMLGIPGQPLSGGQLQRIGLARAVFGNPPIVVLDEPNSNLDQAGEAALLHTIRNLRAQGTTVILMTHRLGVLQEMDHILVLKQGAMANYGPRDEILASMTGTAPRAAVAAKAAEDQSDAKPTPLMLLQPKIRSNVRGGMARPAFANVALAAMNRRLSDSDTPPRTPQTPESDAGLEEDVVCFTSSRSWSGSLPTPLAARGLAVAARSGGLRLGLPATSPSSAQEI